MATGSTINVQSGSSTITFTVTSVPSPPTVKINGNPSWMTVNGNSVIISANNGEERNGTITVSASTTADTEYNGIASATSSYTINQKEMVRTVLIHIPDFTIRYYGITGEMYNVLDITYTLYYIDGNGAQIGMFAVQESNTGLGGPYRGPNGTSWETTVELKAPIRELDLVYYINAKFYNSNATPLATFILTGAYFDVNNSFTDTASTEFWTKLEAGTSPVTIYAPDAIIELYKEGYDSIM